jgi:hypothetical protein
LLSVVARLLNDDVIRDAASLLKHNYGFKGGVYG